MRNGAPVAVLTPPRVRLLPADRLRTLLAALPGVDDAFADDLRRIRDEVGPPGGSLGLLIDTSVFVAQERRGALADTVSDEEWGISVLTVSELRLGVHRATGATRTRRHAAPAASSRPQGARRREPSHPRPLRPGRCGRLFM